MSEVTRFGQRAKATLREQLLSAATDLLAERGYARLRMADVAAAVGVSRQTVYNEFGTKAGLAQAVALRTMAEFADGIQHRLDSAGDVVAGIHDAVAFTVEHARENRLVAAAVGTETGQDLLPLLTTRGEPVLRVATELVGTFLRDRLPALAEPEAVAETVSRLVLSYLVLPAPPMETVATRVSAVASALIATSTTE